MAATKEQLEFVFHVQSSDALRKFEKVRRMASKVFELKSMGANTQMLEARMKQAAGSAQYLHHAIKVGMEEGAQKMQVAALKADQLKKRFDMNALSFLFAGYALQRFGLMITRFVTPSQEMMQDNTLKSVRAMNALNASMQYLKFTMAETLASTPMFENMVNFAIRFTDYIADLVEKYPIILQIAIALGMAAVGAGGIAIARGVLGQWDHLAKLLTGGRYGGITGAIWGASAGLATWAISSKLNFALTLMAILLGVILIKSEELREEIGIMAKESSGNFKSLVHDLLSILDASIDLNDTWRYLGATATWVSSLFFVGLDGVLAFISNVILAIDNLIDRVALLGATIRLALNRDWEGIRAARSLFQDRMGTREDKAAERWSNVFSSSAIKNAELGIKGILNKWNDQNEAAERAADVLGTAERSLNILGNTTDSVTPKQLEFADAMNQTMQEIFGATEETYDFIDAGVKNIDTVDLQRQALNNLTSTYNEVTNAIERAIRAQNAFNSGGGGMGSFGRAGISSITTSGGSR